MFIVYAKLCSRFWDFINTTRQTKIPALMLFLF